MEAIVGILCLMHRKVGLEEAYKGKIIPTQTITYKVLV